MSDLFPHAKQSAGLLSRRTFLQGSARVTFVIGATGLIAACADNTSSESMAANSDVAVTPNIWVTLHADNRVVIKYAGTEMGQGSMTHVPLILAEHLDADWDQIDVEIVTKHDTRYGNPVFQNALYTAGSTHVAVYFNKLATAGTQARKWLMAAVAQAWAVPQDELSTKPHHVVHTKSGREITFGDIVSSLSMPEEIPEVDTSEFKPASEYRYIGKSVMRRDVPAKSDGTEIYGIDIQVPGMSFAAVLHSPVEGDGPLDVDDGAARKIAGVTDVVVLPYGVAVVGDTVEATKAGKSALSVTWSTDSPFRGKSSDSSLREYADSAQNLGDDGVVWNSSGEAKQTLNAATSILDALYTSDPAYHAQMEPMNATASVSDDGKSAEIWVGTQTQSLTILGAAEALETDIENITLHPITMGGGFGRRSVLRALYVDDALFVSRALKRPIKVIWSREDDLQAGQFRAPAAQYLRGTFDDDGKLQAIHHRVAAPYNLPTMNKLRWEAVKPIDIISMLGSENKTYDIPHYLAEHIPTERPCRVVAWRGVATTYTRFANESFIDELAHSQGIDPLEFRLALCHKSPRIIRVLETVATMAGWGQQRDDDGALGIAITELHGSLSAGVAHVSVNRSNGQLAVRDLYAVGDVGLLVSPRNVKAQLLGNIVFGLSACLTERIVVKNGIVQETNFHNYPIMRINEMPNIEANVLSTDNRPTGAGELGVAVVAPAIANALYSLTGKRVRHMPFTRDVVMQALRT
jgi:isoquinoline 1-oxidoreductase beta subunit